MRRYPQLALLLAAAAAMSAQTLSFSPGSTYPAARGPIAIASGDFNGDGKPDLAVGNISSSSVGIYIGNGDGSFTLGDTVSVPGCLVGYLAAADFTTSGHPSLVAACQFQNAIWVLPGLGNGRFGSPVSTTLPNLITFFGLSEGYAQDYGVADFNKDGVADLVIGLTDSNLDVGSLSVGLLLGNGDGTFQAPIAIFSAPSTIPVGLVVGDFNRDGNPDVAIMSQVESGSSGQLQIFLGNGKGAFQAGQNISLTGSEVVASAVADVNGDGIPDLVFSAGTTGSKSGSLYVYIGAGDGTFTPLNRGVPESNPVVGIMAVNLRGTGAVDLVESIPVGSGAGTSFSLQVSAGNGDGTFQTPVPIAFPSTLEPWPFTMLAGDWNGDGLPDLAFAALPADFEESTIFSGGGTGLQSLLMGFESLPAGNLVTIQNALVPTPSLSVAGAKLQFSYMTGGTAPAAQSVAISNAGAGTLHWTATANSPWLSVSPLSGTGPATLTVAVTPGNLSPATYTGAVQITAAGAAGSPQTIAVTLTVAPSSSAPTITGVVNGASFQPGFESGSWVTIQGANLSNTSPGRTWTSAEIVNGNLPISLDDTSVTIDGKPAFVYYISPTQLNVQAPTDSATGTVAVVVTNNGQPSAPFSAQLATASPAFFLYPGASYAIAQHFPDYADVGNPNLIPYTIAAHPGDVLILWATGFGATNPPTAAGSVVTGAPAVVTAPTITVGGVPVKVIDAVLSPGSAGLYQIAIQLSASAPTGAVAIQASVGGAISPAGVLIYISGQ